jgi:glutathione reductase (NADPH)
MAFDYDLIVIGGGSGGLACAQRAADYGARTLVIEGGRLGGTCVNVGCVPKKIMWNAGQIGHVLEAAPDYGFDVTVGRHDWKRLKSARDAFIERLNAIYGRNLERRGVELLRGWARLVSPQSVRVGDREI